MRNFYIVLCCEYCVTFAACDASWESVRDILASRGLASERLFDFSQKICVRRLFSKVGLRSEVRPEIQLRDFDRVVRKCRAFVN